MAEHNELGKKGEELAAAWLPAQGFEILHRNWQNEHHELDFIAKKDNVYHFIEVKTRAADSYGYPEEHVSRSKIKSMMRGATSWLYRNKITAETPIQYDVLSIILHPRREPEFMLFADVSL